MALRTLSQIIVIRGATAFLRTFMLAGTTIGQKTQYSRGENGFCSPPTTDLRRLKRNDRFVPNADIRQDGSLSFNREARDLKHARAERSAARLMPLAV